MTNKRNPFRIAERIGKILLASVLIALLMLAMLIMVFGAASSGWGWWAILIIPGFIIALVVLMVFFALIDMGIDKLMGWWVDSKRAWESENRKESK